jgi:hypothetical protein
MRRLSPRNLLAAGVLAGSAALLSGGCADNESMLFVRGVLAWPPGQCVINPDPSSLIRLGGVLDRAFRSNYIAPLLIGNQLTTRGDRDTLRTESSRVTLRGAVVEINDRQGNRIAHYTADGTGFVDPGESASPGYGIMSVELIPPALTALPDNTDVIVGVRVFGDTLGGREIESSQLTFPIFVCRGCLVSYPAVAIQPDTGECGGSEEPSDPPPCVVGQDDAVDCRYCAESTAECQVPPF